MQDERSPKPAPGRRPEGVQVRHAKKCRSRSGGRCDCVPSARAAVYVPRVGKVRKGFQGANATKRAKQWRAQQLAKIASGRRVVASRRTLRDVAEEWLAGAEAEPPTVLNRSGLPYKPSALRDLRHNLTRYVLPELGAHRVSDVRRGDLQAFVDRLSGSGLSGSKVRNVIVAARVVYRHAVEREEVEANPTAGLRLPSGGRPRERSASATEAAALLAALPPEDRPLWATAFYAGLRRGELMALRWEDVDLAKGLIHVRRSWDEYAGVVAPKSKKGERSVPIVGLLRDHLDGVAADGRDGGALVFGRRPTEPFTPTHVRKLALRAWAAASADRAERGLDPLVPIGLHEARHTFVSLMAAAGVPLERIGDYVGHSSTYMTDRYRHLIEGQRGADARLLDDYLARADTAARVEQLAGDEEDA